ncbi:deoxyguanosinetriphosphate triphosphohydrolase [Chamaesiphon sp. OTE_75_metabat_556]|uniref:deoxyguanosinetriphosphate triphosphohydrolase n=1 Tax=Chamaesiphon sp. OTE_75_metabat_556 TaxID=2964692 RepID=UPI0037BFB9AB
MQWAQLFSRKRDGIIQPEQHEVGRSHFQKDIDRLIFSSAFRRLNHKTQVHPLPENDNIHTRLSHSLEVSSVGRSLGTKVGQRLAPELKSIGIEPSDVGDIVQAACLAHDIGNPPFGHSGEEAIRKWFRVNADREFLQDLTPAELNEFQYFEGNAQGLRVITKLEYYLFEGGMRLTYATLGAFLKYPWTSDFMHKSGKKKFGCDLTEQDILTKIATELGLIQRSTTAWCRHPLAYLMEAADDICYALIDLEDGIEMGYITYDEAISILEIVFDFETIPPLHTSCTGTELLRRTIAIARGKAMNILIEGVVDTFVQQQEQLLTGNFQYDDLIGACGGRIKECIYTAKNTAKSQIFDRPRKIEIEIGSHATIDVLLDAFIAATADLHTYRDGERLRDKSRYILNLMGSHQPQREWSLHHAYMHAIDFISGMTDNYAVSITKQLGEMTAPD